MIVRHFLSTSKLLSRHLSLNALTKFAVSFVGMCDVWACKLKTCHIRLQAIYLFSPIVSFSVRGSLIGKPIPIIA